MNGVGADGDLRHGGGGVCDFISAMDTARIAEWNYWYHLLNYEASGVVESVGPDVTGLEPLLRGLIENEFEVAADILDHFTRPCASERLDVHLPIQTEIVPSVVMRRTTQWADGMQGREHATGHEVGLICPPLVGRFPRPSRASAC